MKYDICHIKDISFFQTSISLMNLTSTPLCNTSDIPPDGIKNKAVVVQWGTCHFLEKARIAQIGGAEALLVANNSVLVSYETVMTSFELMVSNFTDRIIFFVCVLGAEF